MGRPHELWPMEVQSAKNMLRRNRIWLACNPLEAEHPSGSSARARWLPGRFLPNLGGACGSAIFLRALDYRASGILYRDVAEP
jgi:hypothetical protein